MKRLPSLSLLLLLVPSVFAESIPASDVGLKLVPPPPSPPESPSYWYDIQWHGSLGRSYMIETSPSLAVGSWTLLSPFDTGNEETLSHSHRISEYVDGVEGPASRFFVRIRQQDNLLNHMDDDHDRDGVTTGAEVAFQQTEPFSYPDDDSTDTDSDGLPDDWERFVFDSLTRHSGSDVDVDGQIFAAKYQAQRRDTDSDGLPDHWEKYRNGDLSKVASDTFDGDYTQLERYRADRVMLARHRYGAQTFRYHPSYQKNKFYQSGVNTDILVNPLVFYYQGDSGGSMIVTFADTTYQAISHVRVYPGDISYGEASAHTHRADYNGTLNGTEWTYAYTATPATGTEVARDLLRSLDGMPLARAVVNGDTHLTPAKLAITSLPVTEVGGGKFPCILRDFPYDNGSRAFPDFGTGGGFREGMLKPQLDGNPLLGLPIFALAPAAGQSIISPSTFNHWYRHTDASGFNLEKITPDGSHEPPPEEYEEFTHGISKADFFPHRNDVGGQQGTVNGESAKKLEHGFTVEAHFRLNYDLSTKFFIQSDDDLWVFVNGRLAVDSGGEHLYADFSVRNDAYHQRHPEDPRYQYTLTRIKEDVDIRDGSSPSFLPSPAGSCIIDLFYAERETSGATLLFLSNSELLPVYVYQVIAEANWPEKLVYELIPTSINGQPAVPIPLGMSITPAGKIIWDFHALNEDQDTGNDITGGIYMVTVRATDTRGLTATQTFAIDLSL